MLDLGLLKIIWGGVFSYFWPLQVALIPAGPYPYPFPNSAGPSSPLLNLTCPKISINFIIFNNSYKQHFARKCTRSKKYFPHWKYFKTSIQYDLILGHFCLYGFYNKSLKKYCKYLCCLGEKEEPRKILPYWIWQVISG